MTDDRNRRHGRERLETGCHGCGVTGLVSDSMGACGPCLKRGIPEAIEANRRLRESHRRSYHLPVNPPQDAGGLPCHLCANACRLTTGRVGYCGLRRNTDGRLTRGLAGDGHLSWYRDPLPTNCVADWVCPGGTGTGYPEYACAPGPEKGYYNLAVFYSACTFDCLFCQNWHFRHSLDEPKMIQAGDLARAVSDKVNCVCFFGGDPSCQMPHALEAARLSLESTDKALLRICWETNGCMSRNYLKAAAELSLKTGGIIKFDLKAMSSDLHRALTGVSNESTMVNFAEVAEMAAGRPEVPLLVASTLLVPGYIDSDEVSRLARFIAGLDPDIPYSLLAFHPQFKMTDLPVTSRRLADECLAAAEDAGLRRVRLGNVHLLR
jgi:pyruvate formate lyase activating enzyme